MRCPENRVRIELDLEHYIEKYNRVYGTELKLSTIFIYDPQLDTIIPIQYTLSLSPYTRVEIGLDGVKTIIDKELFETYVKEYPEYAEKYFLEKIEDKEYYVYRTE